MCILRFFRTAQFAAAPLRRTAIALAPPSANSVKHRNTSRPRPAENATMRMPLRASAVGRLRPARRRSAAFNRRPAPCKRNKPRRSRNIPAYKTKKVARQYVGQLFYRFRTTAYWPLAFSSSNALLYFSYLACMPSSSRRRNVRAFSDSTVRRSLGFSS